MPDPVTLVILLAAGEAATPTAAAMAQGARDAFAGATTELRETPSSPTDLDAMAAEKASHPDAVAELTWRDADHRHATLRVHLRQRDRWIERSFTFAPSDPAPERGRTLGFAVASVLPDAAATPPPSAPTPATPPAPSSAFAPAPASAPPTSAPAPAFAPASAPTSAPALASAPVPAPASAPAPPSSSAPAPAIQVTAESSTDPAGGESPAPADGSSRDPRLAVDLLGAGAIGVGGSGDTVGGGVALEWFALRSLSLRLGAIERAGNLDVAQARMSTLVTSVGIVLHSWQPTRSEPFAVSLRADYVFVRESATHVDSDDPTPVTSARWVSGIDTFVDASLRLSSQIAAVAGAGLEDVGSPTYIYVRDVRVATLPVLRAVAEAGFQLRF